MCGEIVKSHVEEISCPEILTQFWLRNAIISSDSLAQFWSRNAIISSDSLAQFWSRNAIISSDSLICPPRGSIFSRPIPSRTSPRSGVPKKNRKMISFFCHKLRLLFSMHQILESTLCSFIPHWVVIPQTDQLKGAYFANQIDCNNMERIFCGTVSLSTPVYVGLQCAIT